MTHATLFATTIARCLLLAGLLGLVPVSAQALTSIVATQFVPMLVWATPLPPDAPFLEPCVYVARVTEDDPAPELDAHPRCARLDDQGQPRLEASHLDLIEFDDEGLATAHIAGDWYYLNREGEALRVLDFDNGPAPFSEDLVRGRRGDKIGYFDTGFREVVPARYDMGWNFEDGLALVCLGCEPEAHGEHWMMVGGKYGYIDSKGREVVPVALTRQEAVALREHTLVFGYEEFWPRSAARQPHDAAHQPAEASTGLGRTGQAVPRIGFSPAGLVETVAWPFYSWDNARAYAYNLRPYGPEGILRVYDQRNGWNDTIVIDLALDREQAEHALTMLARTQGEMVVSRCAFPRHAVVLFAGAIPVGSINVCFECGDILIWPAFKQHAEWFRDKMEMYEKLLPVYDRVFPEWERFFEEHLGTSTDWQRIEVTWSRPGSPEESCTTSHAESCSEDS